MSIVLAATIGAPDDAIVSSFHGPRSAGFNPDSATGAGVGVGLGVGNRCGSRRRVNHPAAATARGHGKHAKRQ